jgi:hypothetical protein
MLMSAVLNMEMEQPLYKRWWETTVITQSELTNSLLQQEGVEFIRTKFYRKESKESMKMFCSWWEYEAFEDVRVYNLTTICTKRKRMNWIQVHEHLKTQFDMKWADLGRYTKASRLEFLQNDT